MNYRDYLQQLIYKIINPLIRGMIIRRQRQMCIRDRFTTVDL